MNPRILIDAREFVPGRSTGIGRFLEGLVEALAESTVLQNITLAVHDTDAVPQELRDLKDVTLESIPRSFIGSEKALSDLSGQGFAVYISPYPKLPLFGCHCTAVNTVHDVFDLTHPAYRKRIRILFDQLRVKIALKRAHLTWYDSCWSLSEVEKLFGFPGKEPRVRHLGLNERFQPSKSKNEARVLEKYQLRADYILVLGNGLPHKNLGVLLEVSHQLSRALVFVGVKKANQSYWTSRYPGAKSIWIHHIKEEELPIILRNAFCLAQPSTAEGYGYPPLEAMACGVPAVISDIPVLIETTGGHALTAGPLDSLGWMKTMELLKRRSVYENQIEKGLSWVESLRGTRGWQGHVSDIEELIGEKEE